MGISAMTRRHVRLVAALQVDGLESVFYMGAQEPSAAALTAIGGSGQAWSHFHRQLFTIDKW